MAEDKKEKKVVKKEIKATQVKVTKPNGKVIYRENLKGVADGYKTKGWKVEEV